MNDPDDLDLLRIAFQQSRGRFSFIEVEVAEEAMSDLITVVDHWRFDDTLPFALISRADDTAVAHAERLAHGTLPNKGAIIVFGDQLLLPIEREHVLAALNVARDNLVRERTGPLVLVVTRGRLDVLAQYAPDLHSIRVGQFSIDADTARAHTKALPLRSDEEHYVAFRRRLANGSQGDRQTAFIAMLSLIGDQFNAAYRSAEMPRVEQLATIRGRLDDLRALSPFGEPWTSQYLASIQAFVDDLANAPPVAARSLEAAVNDFASNDAWFEASVAALAHRRRLERVADNLAANYDRTIVFECVSRARLWREFGECWNRIVQYETRTHGAEFAWREAKRLLDRAEFLTWTAGRIAAFALSSRAALDARRSKEALAIVHDRWLPLARVQRSLQYLQGPLHAIGVAGLALGTGAALLEAEHALLELFELHRIHPELELITNDTKALFQRVRRAMGKSTVLPEVDAA